MVDAIALRTRQSELSAAALAACTDPAHEDGPYSTAIPALRIIREERENGLRHSLYRPSLCVNVQGAKSMILQEETFDYAEMEYAVVSVDLPAIGRVRQASPTRPFLALALELDLEILREMVASLAIETSERPAVGVFVGRLDARIADALLRIVRLLETPEAIPILFPLIVRELSYWLLTGPDGPSIARLVGAVGPARYVADAIRSIRGSLSAPIRVEALAEGAGMSPSSFHSHFKAVTAMTPVQYQKRLRLLEARRLMRADEANATEAAYRVGYESVSQFSREYARTFGAPPRRDVAGLRDAA